MNLKKKIDDFAKGREEIRLFLYIVLLPILLPYQLIDFIREVRPERTWKETFLWFFAYFGSYSLGSYLILVLFPDLADKYINKHFLPDTIAILPKNIENVGDRWILIYRHDLAGWISMAWFGLFSILFFLIYTFVLITRADKYRKMLIKAKLLKSNLLDQVLFGRIKTEN